MSNGSIPSVPQGTSLHVLSLIRWPFEPDPTRITVHQTSLVDLARDSGSKVPSYSYAFVTSHSLDRWEFQWIYPITLPTRSLSWEDNTTMRQQGRQANWHILRLCLPLIALRTILDVFLDGLLISWALNALQIRFLWFKLTFNILLCLGSHFLFFLAPALTHLTQFPFVFDT